jgi:hypothetical protein
MTQFIPGEYYKSERSGIIVLCTEDSGDFVSFQGVMVESVPGYKEMFGPKSSFWNKRVFKSCSYQQLSLDDCM